MDEDKLFKLLQETNDLLKGIHKELRDMKVRLHELGEKV